MGIGPFRVTRNRAFEIDQSGVVVLGLPARYGWGRELLGEGGGGDLVRAIDCFERVGQALLVDFDPG